MDGDTIHVVYDEDFGAIAAVVDADGVIVGTGVDHGPTRPCTGPRPAPDRWLADEEWAAALNELWEK